MKKLLLTACAAISILYSQAQIKQGRIVYERTTRLQGTIKIQGMENNPEVIKALSKPRVDRFELLFGNNQSLWQKADDELPGDEMAGGVGLRIMNAGSDDVTYVDINTGKKTDQLEVGDKKFIVEDSIKSLNWKLADETKIILGHTCRKATAETIGKRQKMQMTNGEIKKEEVTDTTYTTAWYATDIPVFAGPLYPKQLPGLILELDINNGRIIYTALELSEKTDVAKIKAPQKGKKVTAAEVQKERENLLQQMQQNMKGGGFRFSTGG